MVLLVFVLAVFKSRIASSKMPNTELFEGYAVKT